MAGALRRAGFEVSASVHRHREALERLRSQGVAEVADPAALADEVEAVILCVPDAPQVEEALFGSRGVAQGAKPGLLVIDMSTISPVASRRFAERLTERGIDFVDAPVSGGPERARAGSLTIMVGASPEAFTRAEPMLRAMGTPHHLGPVGMGETVKLVNQIIIANVMIANAEALVFAKRAGADLDARPRRARHGDGFELPPHRMVAENVAGRNLRRRIRTRSSSQGPCRGARHRARSRAPNAGDGAGISAVHYSFRSRGWRAGLQRDSKGI